MPTSSTSNKSRVSAKSNRNNNNKRIYWPSSQAELANPTTATASGKVQLRRSNNLSNINTVTISNRPENSTGNQFVAKKQPVANQQSIVATKYNKISHISPPTSLTSTSVALRNSIMVGDGGGSGPKTDPQPKFLSRILTSPDGGAGNRTDISQHQPDSPTASSDVDNDFSVESSDKTRGSHMGQFAFLGGKSFLFGDNPQSYHLNHPNNNNNTTTKQHKSQSQGSLLSQPPSLGHSNNSSTAQLQMLTGSNQTIPDSNRQQQARQLHIGRRMDLKYIKSLIIVLMAVDLLVTVFVHQFATNDELNLSSAWLRSFKLRFSFINLVLSSIWFIILIGGILFDIYWILFVSVLVDMISFLLLLGLSVVHFTRRLDYNTIQLTSLLALLFSIVVLHVYLVVVAALTLYLMLVVRRRQRSRPAAQHQQQP